MQIQFTLPNQTLESLCENYIANSKPNQKTVLLNSILMSLFDLDAHRALITVFQLSKQVIDSETTDHLGLKEQRKAMIQLLGQIIRKYPNSFEKAETQHLLMIINFCLEHSFCAVAGNQCIGLMYAMIKKANNDQQPRNLTQQFVEIIEQKLLLDNRMICASYRQITRFHLYTVIKEILKIKSIKNLKTEYLLKVIKLVEDEKDPRNIYCVFQIYELIINGASTQTSALIKEKIFQCLQMYYPIDFQGDAQKHNLNLKMIINQLNKCLASPIFFEDTFKLLLVKMGAPPISKHIQLLLLWISYNKFRLGNQHIKFLTNLLLRTTEQQYILEEYEQSSLTLPHLIVELLKQIISNHQQFVLKLNIYESLTEWMRNLFYHQIFNQENNSKYAGIIIQILQEIGRKKLSRVITSLIGNYVLVTFLKQCKNKDSKGQIVYKLGMLVPIFECPNYLDESTIIDIEKIGLLVMSLVHVFHTTDPEQQQPKLVALKLLMLIASINNKSFFNIVQQTNILDSCLSFTVLKTDTKPYQTVILKSYLDFVIETFSDNQKYLQKICSSFEEIPDQTVMVYAIMTILVKLGSVHVRESQVLHQKLLQVLNKKHIKDVTATLKSLKLKNCIDFVNVLANAPQKCTQMIDMEFVIEFEQIIYNKYLKIDLAAEQQSEEWIKNTIFNVSESKGSTISIIVKIFIMRKLWRSFLTSQQLAKRIKNILEKLVAIQKQPFQEMLFGKLSAFFSAAYKSYDLQFTLSQESTNQKAFQQSYAEERCTLVPFDLTVHHPSNQILLQTLQKSPLSFHATIKSELWELCSRSNSQNDENIDKLKTLLIPYLPTYYLKTQSEQILGKILDNDDGVDILAKGMIDSLSIPVVIAKIVPYIVNLLKKFTKETAVSNIISMNKVLLTLTNLCEEKQIKSDKMAMKQLEDEDVRHNLKMELLKQKGLILIAMEQKFIQHRKRLARQSSRNIFATYNLFK